MTKRNIKKDMYSKTSAQRVKAISFPFIFYEKNLVRLLSMLYLNLKLISTYHIIMRFHKFTVLYLRRYDPLDTKQLSNKMTYFIIFKFERIKFRQSLT